MLPGLIKVEACTETSICLQLISSVLWQRLLARAKGKVDAGYIANDQTLTPASFICKNFSTHKLSPTG